MLLNVSNHPLSQWPPEQVQEAQRLFGGVTDMPFPAIDPAWDEQAVTDLARQYAQQIKEAQVEDVHLMGELSFTTQLIFLLIPMGMRVWASTTTRTVTYIDGHKASVFQFRRFRQYILPNLETTT